MSEYAVQIHDICKRYALGESGQSSLRDYLTAKGKKLASGQLLRKSDAYFDALKDVSFNVKHGEVVGIIGRNGAGKSTLLKILSRITDPSSGKIVVHGKLSSLLEVGTGFHPDLSGRENIFLNGSILGMTRQEISRKYDEIVAFSGIEKFINNPVKNYSSGMYVRLAFSVSAHLEPDILVIDEVLAVGDADFQKRCIGKMQEVTTRGRTVLFVSHNMSAVSTLCEKVVVLESGRKKFEGAVNEGINQYLGLQHDYNSYRLSWHESGEMRQDEIELLSLYVYNTSQKDNEVDYLTGDDELCMELEFKKREELNFYKPVFQFLDADGTVLFSTAPNNMDEKQNPGIYKVRCRVPSGLLSANTFFINCHFTRNNRSVSNKFGTLLKMKLVDGVKDSNRTFVQGKALLRMNLPWDVLQTDGLLTN